jgi:putative tricarboxylic transport membrane protein
MKRIDCYIGIALFFFGIVICIKSFGYPFGSLRAPGAGFFPLFFSILLIILAAVIVANFLIGKNRNLSGNSFFESKDGFKKILLAVLSLLGFRLALPRLGLALTTFLFIYSLGKFLAHYNWRTNGVLALTAAALSYYIFQSLLKIPFPVGIFGF